MSHAITEMYRKADQKLLCSCLTRKDVRKFTEKLIQRTQPWLPEEKVAVAVEALMRDGYEEYQKSLQNHKLDQIKRTLRSLLKRCGCKNEVWDGSFQACKCEETCRGTQVSFFGLVAINRSFCLKLKNLNRERYGRLEIEASVICKTNLDTPGNSSSETPAPVSIVVPKDQAQEAKDAKQDKECEGVVCLKKKINVEELLKEFEIIESIETEVLPDRQGTCREEEHERFLNKVKNVLRCPRCAQNPTKRQCHAKVVKQKSNKLSEDNNKCHRKILADEIGVDALQAQINKYKLSSLENSCEVLKENHQPLRRKFLMDEEGVDALQAQLDFLQLGAQSFSKFLMSFADRKQKGSAVVMLEEIKTKHLRKLKEELRIF